VIDRLVVADAAMPDRPLLVEGVFGIVVEATRRLGVREDLFLSEVRVLLILSDTST